MKEQLNEQIRLNQLEANLHAAEKVINQTLRSLLCDGVGKTIKSVHSSYSNALIVYTDGSYSLASVGYDDDLLWNNGFLVIKDPASKYVVPHEYEAFQAQYDAFQKEFNTFETERRYGKVMRQIKDRYGIDVSPEDLR